MSSLRRRWPIVLLVLWTAYVWVTRLVNAWTVSDESTVAKVISTIVAVTLLLLALVSGIALRRARSRPFDPADARMITYLVVGTAVVWAFRIPQILLDGARDVPFKVVHVVLGVISLALAAASWRVLVRDGADQASGADPDPVSPAANADR